MDEAEPKRRVVFVDLLRLVASFQMVQGHTLDALMAESHRSGPWFDAWTWTRGLTSVAFLFAAGVSFHLATLVRLDAHLGRPGAVRRRVERGLLLVIVGYAMHLPDGPIVDVLQCIGVTLLALEGLALLTRVADRVVLGAAALGVAVALLAGTTSALVPSGPLAPLTHYVTPRGGSIFPVVPWASYMLAGVVIGRLALPRGALTPRIQTIARLAAGAGAFVLAALGAGVAGSGATGWLVKLAAVIGVAAVLAAASLGVARLPRLFETLAGETLALYLFHVVVLYGAGLGLARVVGRSVPLPAAGGLALVAIAVTAAAGWAWHRLKSAFGRRRAALARAPRTG